MLVEAQAEAQQVAPGAAEAAEAVNPQSVIRPTFFFGGLLLFFIYAISAFLSASFSHSHLAVARYAFDVNADNLLEINTNLT